jgi:hypothetical protein
MAEWSKDQVAALESLKLSLGVVGVPWLKWGPGGAHRWKEKTVGWEGRGVECGKTAPSRR